MSNTTDVDMENEINDLGLNAPRVTLAAIEELMENVTYEFTVFGTTTYCHAFYKGFSLATEFTACVDPDNFNPKLGRKYAKIKTEQSAKDKLFELEGWRLKCHQLGM
ncbi:hypothetical protein vBAmePPT11V19_00092 [Alteromonas phage vB_AmeP_PT11-V19]|nr:hypothetical protein vBAmePPT11V19_00092 [Alteromonas phage vB_AmeP_PT11-V19]